MELFFRKYGQGTPLIILHGLYGASDNWVSIAKALEKDFELYLPDLRNHGRSPHSLEHSYHTMVSDLLEFMDTQQIEKTVLLGHSMGGKTAMFFAAKYPERISHLIVADIAPKSYVEMHDSNQRSIKHSDILDAMLDIDLEGVTERSEVDEQLAETVKITNVRRFLLKNLHRNNDNTLSWSLNLRALRSNLYEILDGMKGFENLTPIVGFPVLFIRGGLSDYISDEDYQTIHDTFTYADIVTIANASHWLHAEKSQKFTQIVHRFVFEE